MDRIDSRICHCRLWRRRVAAKADCGYAVALESLRRWAGFVGVGGGRFFDVGDWSGVFVGFLTLALSDVSSCTSDIEMRT